jgi:hypothetical protein
MCSRCPIHSDINVLLRAKNVGHQTSVSFEKFDVVQALLSPLIIVIEILHYSS